MIRSSNARMRTTLEDEEHVMDKVMIVILLAGHGGRGGCCIHEVLGFGMT
jgi:hypothetical protein